MSRVDSFLFKLHPSLALLPPGWARSLQSPWWSWTVPPRLSSFLWSKGSTSPSKFLAARGEISDFCFMTTASCRCTQLQTYRTRISVLPCIPSHGTLATINCTWTRDTRNSVESTDRHLVRDLLGPDAICGVKTCVNQVAWPRSCKPSSRSEPSWRTTWGGIHRLRVQGKALILEERSMMSCGSIDGVWLIGRQNTLGISAPLL
jgi:hypothetical protein